MTELDQVREILHEVIAELCDIRGDICLLQEPTVDGCTIKIIEYSEGGWQATIDNLPDITEYADNKLEAYILAYSAITTTKEIFEEQGRKWPPKISK